MIAVRVGAAADVDAVLDFWATAAEDSHRPADTAGALRQLIARDPGALILAVDGERIVGSVIAGWDGWRCHIYRLAVDPERRREGIGRDLIARAERRFADFGGGRSDAMVLDPNETAHYVWAGAGYRRQAEWSRWVKPLSLAR